MIQVFELSKNFGNGRGIFDMTFQIGVGETVGILGGAGAGKSTLLDVLTGCTAPSSGHVVFCGFDMDGQRSKAVRQIGYLSETPSLYGEMTVLEQLRFVCHLKKLPIEDTLLRLRPICESLGLEKFYKKRIDGLSPNLQRSVGLAQALLGNPAVLILDEPDKDLFSEQSEKNHKILRALTKNRTVLLSSARLETLAPVCGRILTLDKGHLSKDISSEEFAPEKGRMTLEMRAAGSEEAVLPLLRRMYGVASADCIGEREPSCWDYIIRGQPGTDIRRALFSVFSDAGIPVLSLSRRHLSAEDLETPETKQLHAEASRRRTPPSNGKPDAKLARLSQKLFQTIDREEDQNDGHL